MLDYAALPFFPSQLANASVYLANVTLHKSDPWNHTLQYYSKAKLDSFVLCARQLLEFTNQIANTKYLAIRRKYTSSRFNEVSRLTLPNELPIEL